MSFVATGVINPRIRSKIAESLFPVRYDGVMGKRSDAKIANRLRVLRDYGFTPPDQLREAPPYIQELFTEECADFVVYVESNWTPEGLIGAMRRLSNRFDAEFHDQLVRTLADPRYRPLACKKGCNHCCTIRVTTVIPEILSIADYLGKMPSESVAALTLRIGAYLERWQTLNPLAKVLESGMCPLNDDSICTVYPVRPTTCASYHSLDVEKCIEDRQNPYGTPLVPMYPHLATAGSVFGQIKNVSLKMLDLNNPEVEFIPALKLAMENPDIGQRYMDGEDVFATAVVTSDVAEAQRNDLTRHEGKTSLPIYGSPRSQS